MRKRIDDPEFAERMAYSVKARRDRSRELIEQAEKLCETDPQEQRKQEVSCMRPLVSNIYPQPTKTVWRQSYERLRNKEAEGLGSSKERRNLQYEIAESYLTGVLAVVRSRYRQLIEKIWGVRYPLRRMPEYRLK